jgi:hypothetical protein
VLDTCLVGWLFDNLLLRDFGLFVIVFMTVCVLLYSW